MFIYVYVYVYIYSSVYVYVCVYIYISCVIIYSILCTLNFVDCPQHSYNKEIKNEAKMKAHGCNVPAV